MMFASFVSLLRTIFIGVAGSFIKVWLNKIPFRFADGDGVGYGLIEPTLTELRSDCVFVSLTARASVYLTCLSIRFMAR